MSVQLSEDNPLIGEAPAFLEVLEHVSRAAPLSKPVLVIGERGTGKELIAERLHFLSRRWDKAFVKLNCAALAESLLETELFGHEAGAFTGATKRHLGRFELAHEGTLFLDELANTSGRIQEKILRVIEYGEFERVGGAKPVQTDVRIIGATNADLPAMAEAGEFRDDLLDRLAFDVITLPPLRHRSEDILSLAEHFARRMCRELDRELFPGFAKPAQQALLDYYWPGNVRELKNTVERAVYKTPEPEEPITTIQFDPFDSPYRPRELPWQARRPEQADSTTAVADSAALGMPDTTQPYDFKSTVRDFETRLLTRALEENRFNQRKAAEHLGLTYHQLRGYLRKYELLDKGKLSTEEH